MEIKDLAAPVYSISVNPNPSLSQFAFGLGNGQIFTCNYEIEKGKQNDQEGFSAYTGEFARVAKEYAIEQENIRKPYKPNISTFLTKDVGWSSKQVKRI